MTMVQKVKSKRKQRERSKKSWLGAAQPEHEDDYDDPVKVSG